MEQTPADIIKPPFRFNQIPAPGFTIKVLWSEKGAPCSYKFIGATEHKGMTYLFFGRDEAGVTLASKLDRGLAPLDLHRPAAALHRQVRALQPWPGSELAFEGAALKVCGVGGLKAGEAPGTLRWGREGVWLSAGDGQALELTRLQRPGKPVQPALQALQPWGPQGWRNLLS